MHRQFAVVFLLVAGLVAACDRSSGERAPSISTESQPKVATLPAEEERAVSCRAPDAFVQRTGISAVEVLVRTQYENGYNEKSHKEVRYPVSATPVSAYVIAKDGTRIPLPDIENGESEDWSSPNGGCKNFSFVGVGQYALIGHFIGVGNPYPIDQDWFVHLPTHQVVAPYTLIRELGNLELAGPDCLLSIVRGDATSPGQQDKWCAIGDGGTFRRVAGVMSLEDPEGRNRDAQKYYWFSCDRTSGIGKVSGKMQKLSVDKTVDVVDPEISARMDVQCAAWAKDSSAY